MDLIKKWQIIISIIVGATVVLGYFVFTQLNRAKLHIIANEGAAIYVSESVDDPFKALGNSVVDYSTSFSGVVFVEVIDGQSKTQQSVTLKRGETTYLIVQSIPIKTTTVEAPGPLSHIFFDDYFVYGINPNTLGLDYRHIEGKEQIPKVSYINVPFVRKVSWNDPANFIAQGYREGVFKVVDGNVLPVITVAEGSEVTFFNYTKHRTNPLVLISVHGLHIVEDKDIEFVLTSTAGTNYLFSDLNNIYHFRLIYSQAFEEVGEVTSTILDIYDYSGKKVDSVALPVVSEIFGVIDSRSSNSYIILTDVGILQIEKNGEVVTSFPLHSDGFNDMVGVGDNYYILGRSGLWQFMPSESAIYLVSSFLAHENYVEGSLSTNQSGDRLYYSSQADEDSLINQSINAVSNIYSIELKLE